MFLATISHEIRTPLNAILGFSDVLSSQITTGDQVALLKRIRNCGDSLLETINNVLDISSIERGETHNIEQCFNLIEVFTKTTDIFEQKALMTPNIQFHIELANESTIFVRANNTWITQILSNFLSNAFKFTPSGEIWCKLKITESNEHSITIRFTVKDSGIGIHKENIDKIMQPFAQEDGSISRKYGGTGLGLYIVKHYLEQLNGQLIINSEKGQGTECIALFSLPLASSEEVARLPSEDLSYSNIIFDKVLIVDDSEDNRILMGHLFKKNFRNIILAENGRIACDLLKENSYDLVLMDIQMPVLDGYGAIVEIRERERQMNLKRSIVISITAHAFIEEHKRLMNMGYDGCITKPIKKDTFLAELARIKSKHGG